MGSATWMAASPIPGRVVHRRDHIVDEPPHGSLVDPLDRLAYEPELRVRQGDDVAKGHGGWIFSRDLTLYNSAFKADGSSRPLRPYM